MAWDNVHSGMCSYITVLLMCLLSLCYAEERTEMNRRDVLNIILNKTDYDPKISPHYEQDYPTNVSIQLYILSIDSLNEVSMDFSVDLFLRQRWEDPRLNFSMYSSVSTLELDHRMINDVWIPDSYFSNEKEAYFHDVTIPNRLMHIYRNGTVFYSIRISMTLFCQMNLHNYPLDEQICPLFIESYGYTQGNVVFNWHQNCPVTVPDTGLPQFTLSKYPKTFPCDKDYGEGGGRFACLSTNLYFIRNTGYYIAQIFIPSILIVILSWVSFWVDIEATPARISLGVLTVLTMTTQSSGVRSSLPRVSYVKAIDVWMSTCLIFVFASLLEYAYINVVARRKNGPVSTQNECELVMIKDKSPNPMMPLLKKIDFKRRARRIDRLARIMFPGTFILFNIGFWLYYLHINKHNAVS